MGNFGLTAKPIVGYVGPGLSPGRRDGESAREGEGGSPGQNGRDERIANPDPPGPEGAPTVLGRHGGGCFPLHSSLLPISLLDILPALKHGDSLYRTAMPDRKYVLGRVHIAVVSDTTLTASPFSYSQA